MLLVLSLVGFLCVGGGMSDGVLTDEHFVTVVNMIAGEMKSRGELDQIVTRLKQEVSDIKRAAEISNDSCQSEIIVLKNESAALADTVEKLKSEYNLLKTENSELLKNQSTLADSQMQLQNLSTEQSETIMQLNKTVQDMVTDFHILRGQFSKLISDYNKLAFDHNELKAQYDNDTVMFKAEMNEHAQSQSDRLRNVTLLQEEMKSTKSKVETLLHATDARKSDIIALLNMTREATKRIDVLETIKSSDLPKLEMFMANQSAINHKFEQQTLDNTKQVAVSSCATATSSRGVVRFPYVKTAIGFTNLTAFKTTGKFICEIPGLYLVSVYMVSVTTHANFHVYKNSYYITVVFMKGSSTDNRDYGTGTAVQAVYLNKGDMISVESQGAYEIEGDPASCITIMKIK